MFKQLKQYALDKTKLNKHRWYEYYVEVKPVKVTDFYNITPRVFFKWKVIYETIVFFQSKNAKHPFLKWKTCESYVKSQDYDCYELED